MKMRHDPDLAFLGKCTSKQLDSLTRVLTHSKDGSPRLTSTLDLAEEYKTHYPDHAKYWRLIAAELQYYGANSIATMIRGNRGVPYREILMDVCDKLDVNYNRDAPTEAIEIHLLMKYAIDLFEKLTPEEMAEVATEVEVEMPRGMAAWTAAALAQALARHTGFAIYKFSLIVANAYAKLILGRGLSYGANIVLTRSLAVVTGPVGLVFTAVWAAVDIAGPAYRVTIPAVLQVIAIRLHRKQKKRAKKARATAA